jgi:pimeloyl-ACP methyl ester carboxylesterase
MTPDTEGLHPIANTDQSDRVADVIFVHGLGGSSHKTWRHGEKGAADHFFWPEELAKELPQCRIWSFGYAAGFTRLGKPGMIIAKRAGNMGDQLALAEVRPGVSAELGERPLIFITHSMGGLALKSLIVSSALSQDPARLRLISSIRGIVFCGTPHRGSEFASAAAKLASHFSGFAGKAAPLVGRPLADILARMMGLQPHVKEMTANAEPLDLLHDQFLQWQKQTKVPVLTLAESRELEVSGWLGRMVSLGMVVERGSANSSIEPPFDVDADHLALVKPPASGAVHTLVHVGTRQFIKTQLAKIPPAPSRASNTGTLDVRSLILEILREQGALPLPATPPST